MMKPAMSDLEALALRLWEDKGGMRRFVVLEKAPETEEGWKINCVTDCVFTAKERGRRERHKAFRCMPSGAFEL